MAALPPLPPMKDPPLMAPPLQASDEAREPFLLPAEVRRRRLHVKKPNWLGVIDTDHENFHILHVLVLDTSALGASWGSALAADNALVHITT